LFYIRHAFLIFILTNFYKIQNLIKKIHRNINRLKILKINYFLKEYYIKFKTKLYILD